MTASLGASVLVILMFFAGLGVMLSLAVHMESTLERPEPRRARVRVAVQEPGHSNAVSPDPTRAHPHT
jgi:hypothetical protein